VKSSPSTFAKKKCFLEEKASRPGIADVERPSILNDQRRDYLSNV
jgi:hypothetical protein